MQSSGSRFLQRTSVYFDDTLDSNNETKCIIRRTIDSLPPPPPPFIAIAGSRAVKTTVAIPRGDSRPVKNVGVLLAG